ncbi:hypothetical protein V8F20_009587 [Naviculisporaceae sp. PSN 640]
MSSGRSGLYPPYEAHRRPFNTVNKDSNSTLTPGGIIWESSLCETAGPYPSGIALSVFLLAAISMVETELSRKPLKRGVVFVQGTSHGIINTRALSRAWCCRKPSGVTSVPNRTSGNISNGVHSRLIQVQSSTSNSNAGMETSTRTYIALPGGMQPGQLTTTAAPAHLLGRPTPEPTAAATRIGVQTPLSDEVMTIWGRGDTSKGYCAPQPRSRSAMPRRPPPPPPTMTTWRRRWRRP